MRLLSPPAWMTTVTRGLVKCSSRKSDMARTSSTSKQGTPYRLAASRASGMSVTTATVLAVGILLSTSAACLAPNFAACTWSVPSPSPRLALSRKAAATAASAVFAWRMISIVGRPLLR